MEATFIHRHVVTRFVRRNASRGSAPHSKERDAQPGEPRTWRRQAVDECKYQRLRGGRQIVRSKRE
jgi:hypothetical protein